MVDDGAGEADAEVELATGDHLRRAEAAGGLHVLDVREALRAQERLGHVERREADRGRERQADRGRLRRPLGGERRRAPRTPAAPAAKAGQEIAAILTDLHRKPPLFKYRAGRCARGLAHAFSSRLSSSRKRQSVPSARSLFGLDSIMPTSWSRSA